MAEGGTYVYLAQGATTISVLALSPTTGELTKIQEAFVRDEKLPAGVTSSRFMTITVSPDRRFLYATSRSTPYRVRSYAIEGTTGLLTYLGDAPIVDSSPFMSTDRTGRFLFAAYNPADRNRRTGLISVSTIYNGFVQPPHQVIRTPPKTHAVRTDASNRFVFTPTCDGDVVLRFAFDAATGTLDPNVLAPVAVRPGSGPRHCVFHPSNRVVYLLNEYDASVYTYDFDPRDGAVSEIEVVSAKPSDFDKDNAQAGDLYITPDGKWLCAGVSAASKIAIFGVDAATSRLTLVGHFAVDEWPRGFNIDPFGRYLVANGVETGQTVTYTIDPQSGALSKVAALTQKSPNWVEIVRLP